jgi:glyoxylase-like metal-dependent hydrolase (beta-lactamase superfamily II)
MLVQQIVPQLYAVPLGGVNAFLINAAELTLIDTGVPGSADRIIEAIHEIGRVSSDLQHILVTHCHPDHAGGLADLKRKTGALAYMHPVDAAITRTGKLTEQEFKPTPGLEDLFHRFIGPGFAKAEYEPAEIEHEINDGDTLQVAGGISVIHAPGHSDGQLAFLWGRHGGVLFAADAASNLMGLGYHLGYKDFEEGNRTLEMLATLDFDVACFGHGEAIQQNASALFRQKWGA